jgi:hypothetical protein
VFHNSKFDELRVPSIGSQLGLGVGRSPNAITVTYLDLFIGSMSRSEDHPDQAERRRHGNV